MPVFAPRTTSDRAAEAKSADSGSHPRTDRHVDQHLDQHLDEHLDQHSDHGGRSGTTDSARTVSARSDGPTGVTAALGSALESARGSLESAAEAATDIVDAVRPRLRGWLHAGLFPLVVIAGLVLVAATPTARGRTGVAIFVGTACLLFGTSALYHRGRWTPGVHTILRRLDHANIFLIIAGTYTAFALTLLPQAQATVLLWTMWIGAAAGVIFKVVWVGAPRWLSTPLYVALGWVALFYIQPLYHFGGGLVIGLIAAGGVLYTLGALVYGFKRPDPSPRWFGFHEIFHAFTVAAFVAHFAAASIAVATSPLVVAG